MAQRQLVEACRRALVARARSEHAATRQQLRAAARRFLKCHRRNTGYLAWVLRNVAASSTLALALLGLAAPPASAARTVFSPRAGSSNPLNGQDLGYLSAASLGDLDGDGDLDLIAGESNGTFAYLENTGTATQPAYCRLTEDTALAANPVFCVVAGTPIPLSGQDVGSNAAPVLGDLDADGDLDLVSGEREGIFVSYENTGNAANAAFVPLTGAANPLQGQDVGTFSTPAFGDLDNDGDLDLVAGVGAGSFVYLENTGNARSPAFVVRTGAAHPLLGQDVGGGAAPALGDVDRDGDLDLIAGESLGSFFGFENTGSLTSPAFIARTGAAGPLGGEDVGGAAMPSLADLDRDGDLDLVAGEFYGRLLAFEQLPGGLIAQTGAGNPLLHADVGTYSSPALGDLDGDGDADLVVGHELGTFSYFRNTGTALHPAFAPGATAANPLGGQDLGEFSSPALADLDGDTDLDLVAGEKFGSFFYFENTGGVATPAFLRRTGAANPLVDQDAGAFSRPALVDLDADGDLDLVSGELFGALRYFENTGSPTSPAFAARTGAANPLDGNRVGFSSAPSLGDIDRDGDPDLIAGEVFGRFRYFENIGTAASPLFASRTAAGNPLLGEDLGLYATPSLADLDADGDLDLVAGRSLGTIEYFAGTAARPGLLLVEFTGAANPLFGQDAGNQAAPALSDLDADGDTDLLIGTDLGSFRYFENTGDAIQAEFSERTGSQDPLDGRGVGGKARPSFGDVDGDGDLDLLVGREVGDFVSFENTGSATTPAFAAPLANPFGLSAVGGNDSAPSLGDLDADGDLDLVAGDLAGAFSFYENTGSATSAEFSIPVVAPGISYSTPALADLDSDGDLDIVAGAPAGSLAAFENIGNATLDLFLPASPFQGLDLGGPSAPAVADLNGDGNLDLVAGDALGSFHTYRLPEPSQGLLLSAGIGFLAWLERLRRRHERLD